VSIYKALREGKTSIKDANADLRELTSGIYLQQRAIIALNRTYKAEHAIMFESARAMSNLGSVGRTMLNMYNTYTLQQLRMGDAMRDATDIERELSRVTEEYARVVHDLGPESIYAQQLMAEMTHLTEQHTYAVERLSDAQRDNNVMWASMALTVPSAMSNLIYLNQHLSTLHTLLSDSTLRAAALTSAFGTLAGAINTAAAALILYGFYHAVTGDPEQIAQETYQNLLGSSGYGTSNIGGGWGFTPELLESDLPGTSALRDLYLGDNPMPESLIRDYIIADIQQSSGYEEGREYREERVVLNQTNVIRTSDDKTTVDKIADATANIIADRVTR